MSDQFNKSDLHYPGDDAWKSHQLPGAKVVMRGAHVGEVVQIRKDTDNTLWLLSPQAAQKGGRGEKRSPWEALVFASHR